ncbi:hypothetical protein Y032_0076g1011 [Ancylostoma ceylanicum]|uniref:Uncharacterized protein n=1 Tax=Ancylostoma ceylanicum TaxID=53326 RepID=A0A016TTH6_9BILA|nr:hypothetical protein Y032_0076g1011 [Ancylostoma ceylanicum]
MTAPDIRAARIGSPHRLVKVQYTGWPIIMVTPCRLPLLQFILDYCFFQECSFAHFVALVCRFQYLCVTRAIPESFFLTAVAKLTPIFKTIVFWHALFSKG